MLLKIISAFFLTANASDTTTLFEERQKYLKTISFFCEIGREPIVSSADALLYSYPFPCSFKGPLDTLPDPLKIQVPVLRPTLTLNELKTTAQSQGWKVENDKGNSFDFSINGQKLSAGLLHFKKHKDNVIKLGVYLPQWPENFPAITAKSTAGTQALIQAAKNTGIFWPNPHFADEQIALSCLQGPRQHQPLPLVSKCHFNDPIWKKPGALVIAGDLHKKENGEYLLSLLQQRAFSYVALETSRDKEAALKTFMQSDEAAEEALLTDILSGKSKDNVPGQKAILRFLKKTKTPVVFIDYSKDYFYFPLTSTAFHGLPIAARNFMWVEKLPAQWQGQALLFAGLAHFTDLPSADFQDFALERFPGLQMGFISPYETCP